MAYVCDRVGMQSIMDGFMLHNCSCFSVWQGKTLKFQSMADSVDDAAMILQNNLEGIHPNSTALYEIRFYQDVPDKGITNSTSYFGSFTFKMNTGIGSDIAPVRAMDTGLTSYLQRENEELKKRLDVLEQESQIQEPAEQTQVGQIMGYIEKYPVIQELIHEGMNIIKGIFQPKTGSFPGQQAISGIDPDLPADDKLMAALGELTKNDPQRLSVLANALAGLLQRDGDLLGTLDKLSRIDQGKYNMAKSFL